MKIQITLSILALFFITPLISQIDEGTPEIIRGNEDYTLIIRTENSENSKAIDNVEVYLYETLKDKFLAKGITVDGQTTFPIEPSVEYEVRTCHPEYLRNGLSIFECNEGDEVFCSVGGSYYN